MNGYDKPAREGNDASAGWEAELNLRFGVRQERTVLMERSHRGPLMVQRPFYPEGATAHVYVLHPPGGIVGGDRLQIGVRCDPGAAALVTTPAAGKFYRTDGRLAHQAIELELAEGGCLEWLPQETLLFDGARVHSELRVELHPQARFIGWDLVCFGRPASGEIFANGSGRFVVQVRRAGQPLLLENVHAEAGFLQGGWGLRGNAVMATMVAYPFVRLNLEAVRSLIQGSTEFGVTLMDDVLVLRGIGLQAEPLRNRLYEVWRTIRPSVIGRSACPPRIWAT